MNVENQKKRFENKIVLVTGGGSGLGLSMVESFVEEGAKVVVTGRRMEVLKAVADRFPDQVAIFQADVSKSQDCKKSVEFAVLRFGGLDVLVNNAGVNAALKTLDEYTDDEIISTIMINQVGVIFMMRAALPYLIKRKGNVVNLSSLSIRRGFPKLCVYAGTKAAVAMMTRSMAVEVGPEGVRVNAVAPGYSGNTGQTKKWENAGLDAQTIAMTPLGRRGTGEDIARSVLFLASEDANWVTGQCLDSTGGLWL